MRNRLAYTCVFWDLRSDAAAVRPLQNAETEHGIVHMQDSAGSQSPPERGCKGGTATPVRPARETAARPSPLRHGGARRTLDVSGDRCTVSVTNVVGV